MNTREITHVGYVALLGRTNVGKSTLVNKILDTKISITAKKAQTTRDKILGIKTTISHQTIYVDTPGLHKHSGNKLNSHMNKIALGTMSDVDVAVLVTAGTMWTSEDDWILQRIKVTKIPIILAINKVDLIAKKNLLLTHIENISKKHNFVAIIPLSAYKGINIATLETTIATLLPPGPFLFPPHQRHERNDKFWIAEIIREKLTRYLGAELPYAISVVVENMEKKQRLYTITATIYVERPSQRKIILGVGGENLKKIGTLARKSMEKHLAEKVFLQLWIKVKANWTKDDKLLQLFGYGS